MKQHDWVRNLKPARSGLRFVLFLFFWITGFGTIVLTGCSDDIVPLTEPTRKPAKEEPEDPNVTILDPAGIPDYGKFYKPKDLSKMDMLRSDSKWSFVRSKQSAHFIVFWAADFGSDPNASTVPEALRVDIDDLLVKAETFYNVNTATLKFAETGNGKSNLDTYKMQIYLLYQKEWLATGGGYDDMIGALWINPTTCKPVGSTIAHEIGHSFQYQVYADLLASGGCPNDFSRGFRYGFGENGGGGNVFWEQTAQWQSFQSYPLQAFESHNFQVYAENRHRHICHEWQRYASYFVHYYWADRYGIDFIGKLWREALRPEDPLQAYIRLEALSIAQFNAKMYEAATRFVTWDIDAIRSAGSSYIGKQTNTFYTLADGSYQVSYSRCPGSTGYNAIPLNVPTAGTIVSTRFTGLQPGSALASNDPGACSVNGTPQTVTMYNQGNVSRAGWRYGYVALLKNGQRIYGEMNQDAESTVSFTVPEGCEKLWFVVLGAPNAYAAHAWDEDESNDDQWPYKVKFAKTDILGNFSFGGDEKQEDITLTFEVGFAASSTEYQGTMIKLGNDDLYKLAKAFVLQPSEITTNMGKSIRFYGVESNGTLNTHTTANGYGHWFSAAGDVCNWGAESMVYSEFSESDFTFTVGQYPGHCSPGDQYMIRQAFVYEYETGKMVQAMFIFNVNIK